MELGLPTLSAAFANMASGRKGGIGASGSGGNGGPGPGGDGANGHSNLEGAEILAYRPPHERSEATAKLGMVLFLGSWAMMFGALFFAYGVMRSRAPMWPPADQPRLPLSTGIINTAVLACSSVLLHGALVAIRRNRRSAAGMLLVLTAIFGAAFLGLQMRSWSHMALTGFSPSSGPYASVFYGLTWLHAAHVVVGVLALGYLVFRTSRGAYSAPRHLPIRLWSMYWHFVGVVWGLMFVLIYLV